MPARRFDRGRLRRARRAEELSQGDVAAALGVGTSSVAGWEADTPTAPDPEKLPALAAAVKQPLDDLFPRPGLPDLTDLRCDAGLYRYETSEIIGTRSPGPVRSAERGERRLKDRYLAPLSRAYGVSAEELLAAQERSFGRDVPDTPGDGFAIPASLAEKFTYLLQHTYPNSRPPSDQEIAVGINTFAGSEVTDAGEVAALRTGEQDSAAAIVIEGLADYLGVSKLFFASDEEAVRQVVEGLTALAAFKQGSLSGLAARGLPDQGLPADLIAYITKVAEEFQHTNPQRHLRRQADGAAEE